MWVNVSEVIVETIKYRSNNNEKKIKTENIIMHIMENKRERR